MVNRVDPLQHNHLYVTEIRITSKFRVHLLAPIGGKGAREERPGDCGPEMAADWSASCACVCVWIALPKTRAGGTCSSRFTRAFRYWWSSILSSLFCCRSALVSRSSSDRFSSVCLQVAWHSARVQFEPQRQYCTSTQYIQWSLFNERLCGDAHRYFSRPDSSADHVVMLPSGSSCLYAFQYAASSESSRASKCASRNACACGSCSSRSFSSSVCDSLRIDRTAVAMHRYLLYIVRNARALHCESRTGGWGAGCRRRIAGGRAVRRSGEQTLRSAVRPAGRRCALRRTAPEWAPPARRESRRRQTQRPPIASSAPRLRQCPTARDSADRQRPPLRRLRLRLRRRRATPVAACRSTRARAQWSQRHLPDPRALLLPAPAAPPSAP